MVYEARGPGRRRVALKVLHRDQETLWREARLGGLLRHKHLVDVYEIGEEDGRWFCAMELCTGGSLAANLPLPPLAVVEVGLQVCAALGYAHEELSLVHLDLKPDNLLVSGEGVVKVADLGIAHAAGFERKGIAGTPGYMPPEQAAGRPVDARADVFALGRTLIELATGSPGRVSAETFAFDAPVEEPELVPAWLAPVAERCLEPHPADRFPDMAALAEALEALRAGVPGPGLQDFLGLAPTVRMPGPGRTNLPREPNRLVGRERELAALEEALALPGVVTLKGVGGLGKTRLATSAARAFHQRTGVETWFVDLSAATAVEGLIEAVASALSLQLGGDAERQLERVLAARGELVLVLDNFEQLVSCAEVVAGWAEKAPAARFVVTSRVRLGRAGGAADRARPAVDGRRCGPARRARGLARCRRPWRTRSYCPWPGAWDGLPLAIELAAGRLGVLSPADVLERLGAGILRSGEEGRHGTLRAALAWSWELLSPTERAVLAQLTVFAGPFSEADAAAVVTDFAPSVLARLVDHSLVVGAGEHVPAVGERRELRRREARGPPGGPHPPCAVLRPLRVSGGDHRARPRPGGVARARRRPRQRDPRL